MKERMAAPGPRQAPGRPGITAGRAGVFLLLVSVLGCAPPLREGDPAPAFRLSGLDGDSVSLAELKGKAVFLHFWATWCPPCLEELPRLLAFAEKQDPQRFVLLPVSVDRGGPSQVKAFLRSWGLDPHGYLDPGGKLARRYGTVRFPETYVLGPQGTLRKKVIGAGDWDPAYWERFLQGLFHGEEKAPGADPRAGSVLPPGVMIALETSDDYRKSVP